VNDTFERMWKEWPDLRHYPGISLKELKKTVKSLNLIIQSTDKDLHPGPPE
jgi:hypothetical protein